MRLSRAIRSLGPVDLRNVLRDPLLAWIVFYPFVLALAVRFGTPPLTDWLRDTWSFELAPYYPLLASFVVGMAPGMVGAVVGFLLLDERDDRTLAAMMVTPLPLEQYLLYRLGAPTLVAFGVTLAVYPLAGLAPLSAPALLTAAALAGLSAPLTALFLASFAQNKISGFAWVKVLNGINLLPVLAWFAPMPSQLAFGVVPTYWPMKVVWEASAGGLPIALPVAGLVVNLAAVALLSVAFRRRALRA